MVEYIWVWEKTLTSILERGRERERERERNPLGVNRYMKVYNHEANLEG